MKKFILFILSFVVFFCIVATLLLHHYEKKAYSCTTASPYSEVNKVTNLHGEVIDLLILGNSRAQDTYNDSLLTESLHMKCMNLGWPGYPFDYQYHVIWKTFIKQNPTPKYILLEVGPWAFFDYVNPIYIIEMLPYIERPEFQFYVNLCPELSYWDHILLYKYVGKGRQVIDEYKKFTQTHVESEIVKNLWNHNYLEEKVELEHDSTILYDFETFIQECDSLNIQLILVDSPMHIDDGYAHFEMEKFWDLIYRHIANRSVKVLNYEQIYGSDTVLFKNPMHLTETGKDIFTIRVAHDLDSLGYIQR